MPRASYAHISLQVQDGIPAMRADLTKVMEREKRRGVAVVTGTEANSNAQADMVLDVANSFGYLFFRGSDMWVAIQRDRISGKPAMRYYPVSPGKFGAFTAKGVLRVTYTDKWLGKVTHLVSHYKTRGQSATDPETNRKIAALLGKLGREYGAGTAKVIYSGDQNLDDQVVDTFMGAAFLSCWDELKQYPNTHGTRTIDLFASFNPDTRVKLVAARAVPGLRLKGDHVLIEAEYDFTAPIPGGDDPKTEQHGGTITSQVVRNARARGLKVLERHQWGTQHEDVYQTRRRTKPARQPADTVVGHITVTRPTGDHKADMRTLERIGMDRFGSGVSYNFCIFQDGTVGVGQPLDAKGTHTINDKGVAGFSFDQNLVARAIAWVAMPGEKLSAKAEASYVQLLAALMEEGAVTRDPDLVPHSLFAFKDCPTSTVRDKLPRILRAAKAAI